MNSRGEKANMYYPHYRKNSRNVPILSKGEINSISEEYAKRFMPQILEQPQPFNVEGFIEGYLDLQLDYQYLSNDGRYLGMTVFNDTNKVIVYLPETFQADYIHADQGTVIIDNTLLDEKQEHRYRFTLGHESGHWIFHKAYFGYDPYQLTLFEMKSPYLKCRETNRNYLCESTSDWDDNRWMEWHADKFSAGILMPETAVCRLIDNDSAHYNNEYEKISIVSQTFNVSEQAAYLRLCDLGYIRRFRNESIYKQLSFL